MCIFLYRCEKNFFTKQKTVNKKKTMGKVQIVEDEFGCMQDPITGATENVRRFTFSNDNGVTVQVITYGATITSLRCPDKYGNIADLALGFDDLAGIF